MELRETKLSSPVVPSFSAATQQFNYWVQENNIKEIVDIFGLHWQLNIVLTVKDPKGPLPWELKIGMETEVNQDILRKRAIFTDEEERDKRLLLLLGDENIKLHVKPKFFQLKDQEEAKNTLLEILPKLKKDFNYSGIRDVVRKLVAQWLDLSQKFVIGR